MPRTFRYGRMSVIEMTREFLRYSWEDNRKWLVAIILFGVFFVTGIIKNSLLLLLISGGFSLYAIITQIKRFEKENKIHYLELGKRSNK